MAAATCACGDFSRMIRRFPRPALIRKQRYFDEGKVEAYQEEVSKSECWACRLFENPRDPCLARALLGPQRAVNARTDLKNFPDHGGLFVDVEKRIAGIRTATRRRRRNRARAVCPQLDSMKPSTVGREWARRSQ